MRPTPRAVRGVGASPKRPLSLAEQGARLTCAWPQLRCEIRGRGRSARLVCRGSVRPSPVTGVYVVRLEYALDEPPIAIVEAPPLTGRPDQMEIPHFYPASDRWPAGPCLYYPGDGDWASHRSLATTIVPWLLEWLLHYEVWLTTGQWRGGGVEHGPSPQSACVTPKSDDATQLNGETAS